MFLVCLALWFIFNERVTVELLVIGLLVSALVDLFCIKILGMRYKGNLKKLLRLTGGVLKYIWRLLVEIFKANASVIRLIVSPTLEVEPEIHYFRTQLKSDAARVLLANSITLTPGTITCMLEDDRLCVHALDKSLAEGIENTDFERDLLKLEEIAHES